MMYRMLSLFMIEIVKKFVEKYRDQVLIGTIITVSVVIVIAVVYAHAQNKFFPLGTVKEKATAVYNFQEFDMTVIDASKLTPKYIYTPKDAPTLNEIAKSNSCNTAINASYFGGNYSDATHAGYLSIDGGEIAHRTDPALDPQLTQIISYYPQTQTYVVNDANNYHPELIDRATVPGFEFQTGPIVIKESQLQTNFINNSKNGTGKYVRTLLAIKDQKYTYLIIARQNSRLDDIGAFLLTRDFMKTGKWDVVNLDGGPSTALFSTDYPELNFNASQQLPLVLCYR
jgi:exopolysaccharide biosynthesis protein